MYNLTTEGFVKAAMNIAAQTERRRMKPREGVTYVPAGVMFAFVRRPSKTEALHARTLLEALHKADDAEARKPLLGALAQLPIRAVPIKREIRTDRSRYTGERLRQIRHAQTGYAPFVASGKPADLVLIDELDA